MSFKREGDDSSSLNILQKRRVSELLCEDIPADEAHLMKNGKYACMVCHHRPVFDTLAVLQHHRQGKKHKHYQEIEERKKQELEAMKQKRQQEMYLKSGDSSLLAGIPLNHLGQGKAKRMIPQCTVYDPRVKKTKRHDRRTALDLAGNSTHKSPNQTFMLGVNVQTKDDIKPYVKLKCDPREPSLNKQTNPIQSNYQPQTIADYRRMKKCQATNANETIRPYDGSSNQTLLHGSVDKGNSSSSYTCGVKTESQSLEKTQAIKVKRRLPADDPAPVLPVDEARLKRARQYLNARCSGWKKDLSGAWVKDEGAEFDSDEEPPDLP